MTTIPDFTGPDRDHDAWESRASEQRPLGDRSGIGPQRRLAAAEAMKLARRLKGACEREDSDLGVRLWVAEAAAGMMLCAGGQPPAWLTKTEALRG